MMLEVMYGMIPSAKFVCSNRAPTENRLIREYRLWLAPDCACCKQVWIDRMFTPGAGTTEPIRKMVMMKSTNRIFRRRSGVLNAFAKAPNTLSSHMSPAPGRGRAGQCPTLRAEHCYGAGPVRHSGVTITNPVNAEPHEPCPITPRWS